MKLKIILLLSTIIILSSTIGLSGCSQESASTTPAIMPSTSESPNLALISASFITQKECRLITLGGDLSGTLVFENGYLQIKSTLKWDLPTPGESTFSHAIIWPYGYSLSTTNNRIQVLDDKGQIQAQIGDKLSLGGGEYDPSVESHREFIEQLIGKPIPSGILGPYWLVNQVIPETTTP